MNQYNLLTKMISWPYTILNDYNHEFEDKLKDYGVT